MPVTSFDIPPALRTVVDNLVSTGGARNRREIMVRALEIFQTFQAQNWNGPLIKVNGVRAGFFSKGALAELAYGMSDSELYNAGRRMGKALKDLALERRLDI
jgi:hypothetical protein